MAALSRKVERWVEAGLIDGHQGQRILAHETVEQRPMLLYAVAGLASFAIAVGLLSIVAANWAALPGFVKIGLALSLVAAMGAGLARLDAHGPAWVYDVLLGIFYGGVLACIALIGQVYQLGGHAHEALGTWSVLTFFIMWTGRGTFVLTLWLVGLQTSLLAILAHWAQPLRDEGLVVMVALSTSLFLTTLAAGNLPILRKRRPALASLLRGLAWAEIVVAATFATFWFYPGGRDSVGALALLCVAASAAIGLGALALIDEAGASPKRILLAVCMGLALLSPILAPEDWNLVGALLFLGLWLLVAWTAQSEGRAHLLNFATALLGLRILTIYFEVFGSLLGTGLGLIGGGVLTLGLVRVWLRFRSHRGEVSP